MKLHGIDAKTFFLCLVPLVVVAESMDRVFLPFMLITGIVLVAARVIDWRQKRSGKVPPRRK